jgi:hypothetical protein
MQMNTLQGTQATAGGATTANVLSGQVFERAPYTGWARFALTAEAAGESRATIYVGGRVVMQESPVSRQNRVPVIPDDVIATAPMRGGDQLVISHRNTGAGSNTLFWRVDLRPAR